MAFARTHPGAEVHARAPHQDPSPAGHPVPARSVAARAVLSVGVASHGTRCSNTYYAMTIEKPVSPVLQRVRLLLLLWLCAPPSPVSALDNGLALVPQMGYVKLYSGWKKG